jgi:hypothetical protein
MSISVFECILIVFFVLVVFHLGNVISQKHPGWTLFKKKDTVIDSPIARSLKTLRDLNVKK